MTTPDDVLRFWFGDLNDDGTVDESIARRWWTKDDAFDRQIEARFGADVEAALRGERDAWQDTPKGTLALVLLLDQFTRNIWRGNPRAFAGDARALETSREALARGVDKALPLIMRHFLYMPFMHAEDLEVQEESVRLFEALVEESEAPLRAMAESGADYARRHRDIVKRFGRFPHRNAILGRESTDEEREFLKQPGSSF